MKHRSLRSRAAKAVLFALGCALFFSFTAARADLTWTWNYETTELGDAVLAGSGTLTTSDTPVSAGTYTVLGMTGLWSVGGRPYSITGVVPKGGFLGNDNVLSVASPQVTTKGVAFYDSNGDTYEIYNFPPDSGPAYGATGIKPGGSTSVDNGGDFSATVPEPSAYGPWVFAGMAGVVLLRRRLGRV